MFWGLILLVSRHLFIIHQATENGQRNEGTMNQAQSQQIGEALHFEFTCSVCAGTA
jgi:hypothetical protein